MFTDTNVEITWVILKLYYGYPLCLSSMTKLRAYSTGEKKIQKNIVSAQIYPLFTYLTLI